MKNVKGIILDVDGVIVGEKIGFNSPPGKVAHRIDDINYSKRPE